MLLKYYFLQKKYKIETEVENWIAKYDLEMNEKQDEYEDIDIVYTEEKKRLKFVFCLF